MFSSLAWPADRAAATRSVSHRKAPTSSASICSNRSPGSVSEPATQADLDETVRAVEALDRRIVATKADVRDFAALKAAVDDGVAQLGRLDIVLANAGVSTFMGPAEDLSEEAFTDMVDINLTGVWRTAKAAIPHIKAGGRGGAIHADEFGRGPDRLREHRALRLRQARRRRADARRWRSSSRRT